MPGKPFYSLEEVCAKLGKTADEVKGLVRGGTLREFRDAGKVFFKADDIDKLARGVGVPPPQAASEDTGEILLEPVGDTGTPDSKGDEDLSSLSDSSGGTSIIGLEPLAEEEEKKEDTAITARGVGVFDEDEVEMDTDPMAKTTITTGATDDQVSLEGAGSGSGLLDLAREADDTALGADLLDEIYPGEEGAAATAEEAPPAKAKKAPVEEAAPAEEEAPLAEPEVLEAPPLPAPTMAGDTAEGLFSGLLVGAVVLMALASTVMAGVVQGYLPDYARFLGDGSKFYFFLVGAVLTPVIALLIGWFVGKAFIPRRR